MRFLALLLATISAAAAQDFRTTLYPVLETSGCRACHFADGVASATRLQFPEAESAPAKLEAFGRSLVELVDRARPSESILRRKPTGRMPHAGGVRIAASSAGDAALEAWILKLAKMPDAEVAEAIQYRKREASGTGYT